MSEQTFGAPRTSRAQIRWIAAVALILVATDVWVLQRDFAFRGAVAARLASAQNATGALPIADRLANDPALDTALPAVGAGRDVRAHEPPNAGGYLLVALSSCTSCTKFDHGRWTADAKRAGIRLVAISGSPDEDISAFRRSIHDAYSIYRDPDLKLHDSLNAVWNGRLYYFNARWKLRWISSIPESDRHLAGLPDLQAAIAAARKETAR